MNELRVILLIIGVFIIAGIYLWGMRNSIRAKLRERKRRQAAILQPEKQPHIGDSVTEDAVPVSKDTDSDALIAEQPASRSTIVQSESTGVTEKPPSALPDRSPVPVTRKPEPTPNSPTETPKPTSEPETARLEPDPEIVADNPLPTSDPEPPAVKPAPTTGRSTPTNTLVSTIDKLRTLSKPKTAPAPELDKVESESQSEPVTETRAMPAIRPRPQPVSEKRADPTVRTAPAATEKTMTVLLSVVAPGRQAYRGLDILRAAHELNLKLNRSSGVLDYLPPSGTSHTPVFSVGHWREPGTFDLESIKSLSTPGLLLFMYLPGPTEPVAAIDMMMGMAGQLSRQLGGTVCNERRQKLTAQDMAGLRSRAEEFSRRLLAES